MIRCKGRNGWFTYEGRTAWVNLDFENLPELVAYVHVYSSSPHTQEAPLKFQGPPGELIRLFSQLAADLKAEQKEARKK